MQVRFCNSAFCGVGSFRRHAGFTLSAAIRYQLLPFAGVSIQANGLYASLTKMRYYNFMDEQHETGFRGRRGLIPALA